jgi:hypothetical protein
VTTRRTTSQARVAKSADEFDAIYFPSSATAEARPSSAAEVGETLAAAMIRALGESLRAERVSRPEAKQ